MENLLQPEHLFFILLIVLIIFGPGKLPDLGRGLGRAASDLRGLYHGFRGALFMAKGVDSGVGRDVGDMLPVDDMKQSKVWIVFLLAILIGNTLYYLMFPILPPTARMNAESISGIPIIVNLWFCLCTFAVLNLVRLLLGKWRR